MKKQRLMVLLAFSCLVIIATLIGCGTAVVDGFLIPLGGLEPKFAFVVNSNSDGFGVPVSINVYKVNATTGALTLVPGSPFNMGVSDSGTVFIDADPASRFVYVPLQTQNQVAVFSVNQGTGALTPVTGSPFDTGGDWAFAAKLHPSGKFLYVSNYNSDDISVFSVGSDGKLTPVGTPVPLVDGDTPNQIIMDPQGRFLYVSHYCCDTGTMDGFSINSTTGALTPIPGGPFDACDGLECRGGMVDFSGRFLITGVTWDSEVSVLSIAQSGALTHVSGSPFPSGSGPFTAIEVPSGGKTYVAVNNIYDANVSVYDFNTSTGSLAEISGSPFTFNSWQWLHFITIDPSGKFGYAVDFGTDCCATGPSTITGVTIDANGNLTQIPGSPFSNGTNAPSQIIITH